MQCVWLRAQAASIAARVASLESDAAAAAAVAAAGEMGEPGEGCCVFAVQSRVVAARSGACT
jgi:hypothetical protein